MSVTPTILTLAVFPATVFATHSVLGTSLAVIAGVFLTIALAGIGGRKRAA